MKRLLDSGVEFDDYPTREELEEDERERERRALEGHRGFPDYLWNEIWGNR